MKWCLNAFLAKQSRLAWKCVHWVIFQRSPEWAWLPHEDNALNANWIETLFHLSSMVCLIIRTPFPSSYLDSTLRCVSAVVTETRRCLWKKTFNTHQCGCPKRPASSLCLKPCLGHIYDVSVGEKSPAGFLYIMHTFNTHCHSFFYFLLGIRKVC